MLKRRQELPIETRDVPIYAMPLHDKHYVYEVVRDELENPSTEIQCILTRHVDG